MKIVLAVIGTLALLLALAIGGAFYFTSGITQVSEDFFAALRRGDDAAARELLSQEFLAASSQERLQAFLAGDMRRVTSTHWSSRKVENRLGHLEGELGTQDGGRIPVSITLVKEDAGWRIQHILRKAGSGLSGPVPTIPEETVQLGLVRSAMADFVISLNSGDMSHFHATVSDMFRTQFSVAQLNQAYRAVINYGADWSELNSLQPRIEQAPSINDDGVLVLAGSYPTQPNATRFQIKYVQELGQWKVLGLNLNIGG